MKENHISGKIKKITKKYRTLLYSLSEIMTELKKIKEAVSKKREIYEPLSIDPIPMEVKNIERRMEPEKSPPLFIKMEN